MRLIRKAACGSNFKRNEGTVNYIDEMGKSFTLFCKEGNNLFYLAINFSLVNRELEASLTFPPIGMLHIRRLMYLFPLNVNLPKQLYTY